MLDDRTGRIEVTLYEEQVQQFRELLVKDALVLVEGALRFDDFSNAWRIAGKRIVLLDSLREQQARRLVLRWPEARGAATAGFHFQAAGGAERIAAGPLRSAGALPRRRMPDARWRWAATGRSGRRRP